MEYNTNVQEYRGIKFKLIKYTDKHFANLRAKRFMLVSDNDSFPTQNVWIPNAYLKPDGTVKKGADIDFVFKSALREHKLKYAYIDVPDWLKYWEVVYGLRQ